MLYTGFEVNVSLNRFPKPQTKLILKERLRLDFPWKFWFCLLNSNTFMVLKGMDLT